jgi:hypothetical protein
MREDASAGRRKVVPFCACTSGPQCDLLNSTNGLSPANTFVGSSSFFHGR